jgi:hypothetical protein
MRLLCPLFSPHFPGPPPSSGFGVPHILLPRTTRQAAQNSPTLKRLLRCLHLASVGGGVHLRIGQLGPATSVGQGLCLLALKLPTPCLRLTSPPAVRFPLRMSLNPSIRRGRFPSNTASPLSETAAAAAAAAMPSLGSDALKASMARNLWLGGTMFRASNGLTQCPSRSSGP